MITKFLRILSIIILFLAIGPNYGFAESKQYQWHCLGNGTLKIEVDYSKHHHQDMVTIMLTSMSFDTEESRGFRVSFLKEDLPELIEILEDFMRKDNNSGLVRKAPKCSFYGYEAGSDVPTYSGSDELKSILELSYAKDMDIVVWDFNFRALYPHTNRMHSKVTMLPFDIASLWSALKEIE